MIEVNSSVMKQHDLVLAVCCLLVLECCSHDKNTTILIYAL
jgi:hypothetical protein